MSKTGSVLHCIARPEDFIFLKVYVGGDIDTTYELENLETDGDGE